MGFVSKLFSIFVPLIAIMVFFYQRDHILDKKQNEYLDEQFDKLIDQANYHFDGIVQQLNQFVAESKDIIGTNENEKANDEIDLKEKLIKQEEKLNKEAEIKKKVKKEVQNENVLNEQIKSTDKSSRKCDLGKDILITKEQLSKHNGEDAKKKIYLAFLGKLFKHKRKKI